MQVQRKVMILAHQIRSKANTTLSEALKQAWKLVKETTAQIITFVKKNGKETTRVVGKWSKYNTIKGTGRSNPAYLLFADLAKVATGKNNTISVHPKRIKYPD